MTYEQMQVNVKSTGVLFIYLQAQGAACVKLHLCPSHLLLYYGQLIEDSMAFSPLSRFLFPPLSRSSLARSFGATSTFVLTMLLMSCMILIYVRRYLSTCYTWKTLLNHIFYIMHAFSLNPKVPVHMSHLENIVKSCF